MKVNELNTLIENIVSQEVKKTILEQSEGKKEVFHIMCDGEPVDTFDNVDEAKEHVDKLKKEHPGKQFIIEKASYESHDHMIDKLDEMGEHLEEKEQTMKKQPNEGNAFTGALDKAKDNDEKTFDVGGHEYQVEETEEECMECGDGYMEETWEEESPIHQGVTQDYSPINEGMTCNECGVGYMDEETGCCNECGASMMEHAQDGDPENVCPKCGKQLCECGMGMYESATKKKKVIRLKESELVNLIKNMVSESMKGIPQTPGVPGVTFTKKAQQGSKKENDDAIADVEKRMKDYLNFDGNDHSEFPHQNGMATKKAAIVNTKEQDEEIAKNYAGLQNLDYDLEPSQQFKDRAKKAIEGHTTMGNAPTTEKASIKPSNGADKGNEAKEKSGSSIPTPDTAKKINKQVKDRQKDKDNRVLYPKESIPVNESKVNFTNILTEEINKMKNLSSYNKKTQ
jgi:hypothetical protein